MIALITNYRTKEVRYVNLVDQYPGWSPKTITLEEVADRLIKRIAHVYPKAYKVIVYDKLINIIAGNSTKCIFELRCVEKPKDYDDTFFC